MERALTHRQIQELLGAYALDAVDADEAEEVQRHLAECPRCRDEVAGHREAAAMLAHVGAPAPEGVWDKIAGQLGAGAPVGEADAAGRSGAVSGDDAQRAAARITSIADARQGTGRGGRWAVDRRNGSPRSAPQRFMAAALAAAAVIAGVLGVQVVRVNSELRELRGIALEGNLRDAALLAASAPDARKVRLKSDDGTRHADAVLLPNGQAYLMANGLPALSTAETYQLWAVIGDQKISVGVLGNNPTVAAFNYHADPSLLAITAEKEGGVVASEKQAVVVGAVAPKSA